MPLILPETEQTLYNDQDFDKSNLQKLLSLPFAFITSSIEELYIYYTAWKSPSLYLFWTWLLTGSLSALSSCTERDGEQSVLFSLPSHLKFHRFLSDLTSIIPFQGKEVPAYTVVSYMEVIPYPSHMAV